MWSKLISFFIFQPHSDANAPTSGEPESCENGKISDSDKNADESLTFSTLSSLKSDSIDLDELNFEFDYEPNEKDRNLVQVQLLKILVGTYESLNNPTSFFRKY